MIDSNLDYQELPWIKNDNHFTNRWWGSVRREARESIDFLNTHRHDLIKSSLYNLNLTKLTSLKTENIEISKYIENRRSFWNFIPQALKTNT